MRSKSRSIFSNKLLADDPGKASHPMRDLDASEQKIVEAAARFSAETVAPNAEAWDTAGRVPDSFFTDAAKLGLCKLVVPRELDGLGLSATAVTRVAETLAQTSMESAFALLVHNNLAGSVAKNAPAPLIEEQLARMMCGENVGAFLLTEPDFGGTYANRGILHDRLGSYELAIADYARAMELDPELAEGPHWMTRFLRNQSDAPPTIADRLGYLRAELAKPEDERVLRVLEEDAEQRPYQQ